MKKCQICGKSKHKAVKRKKLRGKFNPVKTYFQKPNLQILTVGNKKILVCKDCRRLVLKEKVGC
jgi:hypothetical protein